MGVVARILWLFWFAFGFEVLMLWVLFVIEGGLWFCCFVFRVL